MAEGSNPRSSGGFSNIAEAVRRIATCREVDDVARYLAEATGALTGYDVDVALREGGKLRIVTGSGGEEPYLAGHRSTASMSVDGSTVVTIWLSGGGDIQGRLRIDSAAVRDTDIPHLETLAAVAGERIHALAADSALKDHIASEATFVDRFAHDVKTPLTSILGLAQTLRRRDALDDRTQDEFIERIEAASRDLEKIVDRARVDLKVRGERLDLDLETIDLVELVDRVTGASAEERPEKAIEMRTSLSSAEIESERKRLEKVLKDVIDHAMSRARARVVVELSADRDDRLGEAVYIAVTDDGTPADGEVYDEGLWYMNDPGGIGRPPGDPMELIHTSRTVRVLGGSLNFVIGVDSDDGTRENLADSSTLEVPVARGIGLASIISLPVSQQS